MPDSFTIFSIISVTDFPAFSSFFEMCELNSWENKYKKQGKIIQFQNFLVIDRLKI